MDRISQPFCLEMGSRRIMRRPVPRCEEKASDGAWADGHRGGGICCTATAGPLVSDMPTARSRAPAERRHPCGLKASRPAAPRRTSGQTSCADGQPLCVGILPPGVQRHAFAELIPTPTCHPVRAGWTSGVAKLRRIARQILAEKSRGASGARPLFVTPKAITALL